MFGVSNAKYLTFGTLGARINTDISLKLDMCSHLNMSSRTGYWTQVPKRETVSKEEREIIKKNFAHVMRFDFWCLMFDVSNAKYLTFGTLGALCS